MIEQVLIGNFLISQYNKKKVYIALAILFSFINLGIEYGFILKIEPVMLLKVKG